jgi:WhiB family redox-sensing transcriptional regulator
LKLEAVVDENPDQYVWMLNAKCRGVNPAEFFPSDGSGVEVAQRMCAECPVRAECLEYALENRIDQGVWGGASERERRRILRRRRELASFS